MDSSTDKRQGPANGAAVCKAAPAMAQPEQKCPATEETPSAPELQSGAAGAAHAVQGAAHPVRPKPAARRERSRTGLWALALALVFGAAFLLGAGGMQLLLELRQSARRMPTVLEGAQVGEELDASLAGVDAAEEMTADASGRCLARIENKPENENSARVQIVRTATGEVLYESGLIDPGYYVEYIDLNTRLRAGWYPCRVVWEFYDPATLQPVGKAAQSAVLIVQGA